MVLYECHFCNLKTKLKTDYVRHLKSLKHKKNIEKQNHNLENMKKETILGPQKDHLWKKETILGPQKDHFCPHCNKGFKHKTHLYRHLKSYCKVKKKEENILIQLEECKKNMEDYKKELENNKKEKEKLYDYIDKLIEKTGDTNINIENQTNNQINLNNFGEEDTSHITDNFKMKMLTLPYGMVQQMIEKVHFSSKKPENKNIALTNKRDKMLKVFRRKKWKYQDRDYVIDELIKNNYNRLDEYFEEVAKNKMNPTHNKRYLVFQKKFDRQDEELMKRIKRETEMILLSDNL